MNTLRKTMKYVVLIMLLFSLGLCQERVVGEKEVTSSIQVRIIIPPREHGNDTHNIKETPDNAVDPYKIKDYQ